MPTFKSDAELRSYILKKSSRAVAVAAEKVYKVIEEFVMQYYNDYTPEQYERTYQLLTSLVKSDIRSTGNGVAIDVYFDAGALSYSTGTWGGEEVLSTALHGSHGGYTRTAPIMGQSLNWLNAHAIEELKKALIAQGIPVK